MLEDTELTLEILRHFAKDEVPFPADLTESDIYDLFPDKDRGQVAYSLLCAKQAGLLMCSVSKSEPLSGPVRYAFVSIEGLTQQGGEYVRFAEDQTRVNGLIKSIKQKGWSVTTSLLIEALKSLALAKVT